MILLPVYAASETPLDGGCIEDLYAHFRHSDSPQHADTAVSAPRIGPRLKLARTLEEAWAYLRLTLASGDLVVIAGAGDVIGMVDLIRADLARGWPAHRDPEGFEAALRALPGVEAVPFGALTHWSYYQVGGWARWRVEVVDEAALTAVVRLCNAHGVNWRFVGAGANSWFSDLGEAGCVVRFAPGAFRGFDVHGDEVTAECGWMRPALLDRLEREGFSGLECLDSVPGTLGGWLAMNAGAHGGEIGARVAWIRCLNPVGEIAILDAIDCGFGYRRCDGLAGCVALACGLRLERTTPEQVATLRKAVRAKRMPLSGLRCAGSVFKTGGRQTHVDQRVPGHADRRRDGFSCEHCCDRQDQQLGCSGGDAMVSCANDVRLTAEVMVDEISWHGRPAHETQARCTTPIGKGFKSLR